MRITSHLVLFVLLAIILSFTTPLIALGSLLGSLALLTYIPGLEAIAHAGIDAIAQFLITFGSGSSVMGSLIVSLTCGFVGGLFQLCTYYRYQHL